MPNGKQTWFSDFSRNSQTSQSPFPLRLLSNYLPETPVDRLGRGPCHGPMVTSEGLGPRGAAQHTARLLTRAQCFLATECTPVLSELSWPEPLHMPSGSVSPTWKTQEAEAQGGDGWMAGQMGPAAAASPGCLAPTLGSFPPTSSHVWTAPGIKEHTFVSDFLLLPCSLLTNVQKTCLLSSSGRAPRKAPSGAADSGKNGKSQLDFGRTKSVLGPQVSEKFLLNPMRGPDLNLKICEMPDSKQMPTRALRATA